MVGPEPEAGGELPTGGAVVREASPNVISTPPVVIVVGPEGKGSLSVPKLISLFWTVMVGPFGRITGRGVGPG
jgi:hypothetical protein